MNQQSRKFGVLAGPVIVALVSGGLLQAGIHEEEGKKAEGVDVGPGEMGISATIIPGPPLTSDQVRPDGHFDYPRGMTCAECHDVTFDGLTSATMQFVNNFGALDNDEIWSRIVEFLPGRERFAIATVQDGVPIATTVDMVLDPEEKVLFVVSEKGTEKLMQLRKNPNISAVRFKGWTVAEGGKKEWISVQIRGTAEIIESDDERFMGFLEKYNLVRVTPERAVRRFDLIRVTPQQIYYFNTNLGADKKSVYQLWQRDGAGA